MNSTNLTVEYPIYNMATQTRIIQLVSKSNQEPVYVRTSSDGVNCDGQVWQNHGVVIPTVKQNGVDRIVLTKVLEKVPDVAQVVTTRTLNSFKTDDLPTIVDNKIKQISLSVNSAGNTVNLNYNGKLLNSVTIANSSGSTGELIKSSEVPNVDYYQLQTESVLQQDTKPLSSKATMKIIEQTVGWTINEIDSL